MSIPDLLFRRLGEDREEHRKRLQRTKVSQELKQRYIKTSEHDLFLRIARKLNLVPYWFLFTEEDNSCLYICYDFYLSPSKWFQIFVTWGEDGSVEFMIYDGEKGSYCDPNNNEELIEKIEKAINNPKIFQPSVT